MKRSIFKRVRENIIGIDQRFDSPDGLRKIIYADWTASGRLYRPIEERMMYEIYPWVGNTHTETSVTGSSMTQAYHQALQTIKRHVNAGDEDVIISSNSGMTGVVNKFQRILGLRVHESYKNRLDIPEADRPVIFVTHMEHHSNQTSWLETIADVVVIRANKNGLVDLEHLEELCSEYSHRKTKIAAVTSCSNVTGVITAYHAIAEIIHAHGGVCFVDFACSAPYIDIDMHPQNEAQKLDAIYFSPHKFLGGPGTTGILIFCAKLYSNKIPDNPGGGTVMWTNPWGAHKYVEDIEAREDGGTPAFLQTIKTALCIRLKEEMGTKNIKRREEELLEIIWDKLGKVRNLAILAPKLKDRLGVVSFTIDELHYNLGVRLLNDRFGIQVRGGCSCAGTYGHYLLGLDENKSQAMSEAVDSGNLYDRPGWIRLSIHPTMSKKEVRYICDSIAELAQKHKKWKKSYTYNPLTNEFHHKKTWCQEKMDDLVEDWFEQTLV